MAVNKRLLQGATAAGGLVPSEHFGVVLYEGDGSSSHSINGGKFGAGVILMVAVVMLLYLQIQMIYMKAKLNLVGQFG